MSEWKASWSGRYPNLCSGEWVLFKDGNVVDTDIPFQGESANTFGSYDYWYFNSEYMEDWKSYVNGMQKDEWCEEYKDWLSTIALQEEWEDIYFAFQENDWREMSCGGCI